MNKTKSRKIGILKYASHIHEMFYNDCYISPTKKKGEDFDNDDWKA